MVLICFIAALIFFIVAALSSLAGWSSRVDLVSLGLFFLTLAFAYPLLHATL